MAVSYYNNASPTQPIRRGNQSRTPSLDKSTINRTAATVAKPPEAKNPTEHFFKFTESMRTKLKIFFNDTNVDPTDHLPVIINTVNQSNPSPAVLKALIAMTLVSTFDLNSTPPRFGDPLSPDNKDLNGTKRDFLDQIANHIVTRTRTALQTNVFQRAAPNNPNRPSGNGVDAFLQHSDTLAFESIAKELQPYLSTDGAQNISRFLGSLEDLRTARRIAQETSCIAILQDQPRTS